MSNITTLKDLADAIYALTPEQQKQPIQVVKPSNIGDHINEMMPAIAIDTVREFGFYACRSTHNNKFCPDDVVILIDRNHFSEDGAIAYQLGESWDDCTPIYGKDGQTKKEDQINPYELAEYSGLLIHVLEHRIDQIKGKENE